MNIVAVTACPTGIAHTYMAAEQLERTGKKLGHVVRVETQGAMGVENPLSEAEIAAARVVILAADIAVQGRERFAALPLIEVSVQEAIKNPTALFARLPG
jgi:PTS system fructose-specific IIB component/fructose-specific PTS system IIB-like component